MRVRWTTPALEDFVHVVERIRDDNPAAAHRIAQAIYRGIELLRTMPNGGLIGRVENTRELVFSAWPYIVVYEVIDDLVHVLRVRHASQDWP